VGITMIHPTQNENVRQAATGLWQAGLLHEFITAIDTSRLARRLPDRLAALATRRAMPSEFLGATRTYPATEVLRLVGRAIQPLFPSAGARLPSIEDVYMRLDLAASRRVARMQVVPYAYEDGALATFEAARRNASPRIYELPIGYWRAHREALSDAAARRPEWLPTLKALGDPQAKLDRKDEELRLATTLVVASTFTASTLSLAPSTPTDIIVIPYGFPPAAATPTPASASASERLRIIFVGHLSQRKGLADLLDAVSSLRKHVDLTIVGRGEVSQCRPLASAVEDHRHIPYLPHSALLREMRGHDVLAFPSLFEGFGLVLTEAMAQGLAYISTSRTAAPDLDPEGRAGIVVEPQDSRSIEEALVRMIEQPGLLASMKESSLEIARRYPWTSYRSNLSEAVRPRLPAD
jgi:starch synthase